MPDYSRGKVDLKMDADWVIIYYAHGGPYTDLIERLKSSGIEAQAFLDPQCKALYVHEQYTGKGPYFNRSTHMTFYLAVSRENAGSARQILGEWMAQQSTPSKRIKRTAYYLFIRSFLATLSAGGIIYLLTKDLFQCMIGAAILWFFYYVHFISAHEKQDRTERLSENFPVDISDQTEDDIENNPLNYPYSK